MGLGWNGSLSGIGTELDWDQVRLGPSRNEIGLKWDH